MKPVAGEGLRLRRLLPANLCILDERCRCRLGSFEQQEITILNGYFIINNLSYAKIDGFSGSFNGFEWICQAV